MHPDAPHTAELVDATPERRAAPRLAVPSRWPDPRDLEPELAMLDECIRDAARGEVVTARLAGVRDRLGRLLAP